MSPLDAVPPPVVHVDIPDSKAERLVDGNIRLEALQRRHYTSHLVLYGPDVLEGHPGVVDPAPG